MGAENKAANPINPRGIPRGIAKKDVYRELARLDQEGPDPLERVYLRDRHRGAELIDDPHRALFTDGCPPRSCRRPSAKDAAALLLQRADLLDYIATHPTVEDARQAVKKMWSGDEPEARRFWGRFFAQVEQGEEDLVFDLLRVKQAITGLSPEERSYFEDLRFLRAVFQTLEGVPLRCSREAADERFRTQFGRPPNPPPPALAKEVRAVQRKRRRRENREANFFRRQLGNLAQLASDKQGRRIGEWRRAIKRHRTHSGA